MRLTSALMVSCAAGLLLPAEAQDGAGMFVRDRNVSVLERPRPEYQSSGIQSGAFVYTPTLRSEIELNDNIFATASNEESDTILVINPGIDVASTWSRHSLTANASVTHRDYFDFSSESVTDYSLGADLGLDVGRGYSAGFGARYDSLHEPRTSAGAAGRAAEPITYDKSSLYATATREIGRTRLSGGLALDQYDYDDAPLIGGGVADQDNRDRDELNVEARGDFAISPDTALFARVRYIDQEYTGSEGGAARDQNGYTFDLGADFDLGNLARGEVGIGYLTRSFDDPAFEDVNGLSVDALVEWFPTPLMTVNFAASRNLQPAAVANSPAFISASASVGADYELRRNIILSASASLGQDEYEGIDRKDDRSDFTIGGTYFMNRYVGLSGNFVRTKQDSSGADGQPDFTVNKILFGVVLQR